MVKRKIYVIGAILVVFLLFGATNVISSSEDFKLGKKFSDLQGKDNVIALINGIPLTETEFESRKLFLELQGSKAMSNFEIIKSAARNKLLRAEAEKAGVVVTKEDVKKTIKNFKEQFKIAPPEVRSEFLDFIAGQGYTENAYWNDPKIVKVYEETMYIGHALRRLESEVPEDKKNTPEEMEIVDKMVEDLVESAKIEILDTRFKE